MVKQHLFPAIIPNWIGGEEAHAKNGKTFSKCSPATGKELCRVAQSEAPDVDAAILAAQRAQPAWGELPAVGRGEILYAVVENLRAHRQEMVEVVAAETGKSLKDAAGETAGAIAQGLFMAGEGMRFFGRTTTSNTPHKQNFIVREPMGLSALIVAANTPIANIAWKVFPALICGNAALLKASEDTPATAWLFAKLAHDGGIPPGILNVVQGFGKEAGAPLVADPRIDLISFTGSTAVGKYIAATAGPRLTKISLELGGKNPFVVCDDADLARAAEWAILSTFSNAGQRCAAGSRLIIFASVYDRFCELLVDKVKRLKVGTGDADDFGPVINERQLQNMLAAIDRAVSSGAKLICGGMRLTGPAHGAGYFMAPTLLEEVSPDAEISQQELFGPIACLYRAKDYADALQLANHSSYGLTACIHTKSIDRALDFSRRAQAGVAMVNAGTFGSEPHMPFGGIKLSGNGTREPGPEALDVYSRLKNICLVTSPDRL